LADERREHAAEPNALPFPRGRLIRPAAMPGLRSLKPSAAGNVPETGFRQFFAAPQATQVNLSIIGPCAVIGTLTGFVVFNSQETLQRIMVYSQSFSAGVYRSRAAK